MLQCQVGQVDLLGQSDGHLASVTREGPAVARRHVGLEGAGAMGTMLGGGVKVNSSSHHGSPDLLCFLDEPDPSICKA